MLPELIDVPHSFGPLEPALEETLAMCHRLRVPAVVVGIAAIEAWLGAPLVPAGLQSLPEEAMEAGLTESELEILQDEVDMTRRAFAAHVRVWRESVEVARLDAMRERYAAAGIEIAAVASHDLVHLSDSEVGYMCRIARVLGASTLVTPLTLGGPRRLGPFGNRHGVSIAFDDHTQAVNPSEFQAAFAHGPAIRAIIDLRAWIAQAPEAASAFFKEHAERIAYARLCVAPDEDATRVHVLLSPCESLRMGVAVDPRWTASVSATALAAALELYRMGSVPSPRMDK